MKPKVKNWIRLMESGQIKTNIVKVLHFVYHNPDTDIYAMRKEMNMPHQTLTATISLLADEGLIKYAHEVEHKENFYSAIRFVTDEAERKTVVAERHLEKFRDWCKRGLSDFDTLLNAQVRAYLMARNGSKMTDADESESVYKQQQLF